MIHAVVAQFPVSLDIQHNYAAIVAIIETLQPHSLLVLPEGALSGYAEDPAFLDQIDHDVLTLYIDRVRQIVVQQQVHVVFGTCLREHDQWFNVGMYLGASYEQFIYRKVNLAISERGAFTAGSTLEAVDVTIGTQRLKLGIQLCREIRFPEQWQALARSGVDAFAFLTNAVGDNSQAAVWRSHLISRAAENQRFVLAANTAHDQQKCPSMIVTPQGHVVWETTSAASKIGTATLDLALVSNWYLSQSRRDVL